MSAAPGLPPLRVEQALRLLPDVDALAPLRAFLVAASRAGPPTEPYRTVGKRYLSPGDLRQLVPQALSRVTEHLSTLYEAAVEALEAEQRGDLVAVVRALVRAGEREERVGRDVQAFAWYDHALRVAEELRDRRPEIEALLRLGRLETSRGRLEPGARYFQRSLALADAERDLAGAAKACRGLGHVALAHGQWQGAEAWFTRGLRHADTDLALTGHLLLGLAEVARRRGQLAESTERLRRALANFEQSGDVEGSVRALNAWGVLEAMQQRYTEALTSHREALARLKGTTAHPCLEMTVRLAVCQLYLDWGRLRDAEDEVRRAEEAAIALNCTRHLARLYVVMGKVLGRQGDETGFVFFEKAIELCRGSEPAPRLEAEVYWEYGRFRSEVGDREEARAYLERARDILHTLGDWPTLTRVEEELAQMPSQH